LNAFTGKLLEKPHDYQIRYLKNSKEWHIAHKELIIDTFEKVGDYDVIGGTVRDEFITYSPVQFGVLVYSYSRRHMFDNVYSKIPREKQFQTDTDSVFLTAEALEEYKKTCPQMFDGEEFGQLEVEDYKFDEFFAICPKVYCGLGKEECDTKF
jgi:hypothetical protein